jgi:2-C-methyl-D-erythritol 4-phosphate cytidylyltransferase
MTECKLPGKVFAVVPAAGVGRRMGMTQAKQYLPLLGKTVLEHTLHTLLQEARFDRIVVTTAVGDQQWRSLPVFSDRRIMVVDGGDERCHSVINGLRALAGVCSSDDWVLVHDVARPCISLLDINNMLSQLANDKVGGLLAVPCNDTIKRVNDGAVAETVDRSVLWQAQTPQMFRYQLLLSALSDALQKGLLITDEASAIEAAGYSPQVVTGSSSNIKITTPEDLKLAEFYLQKSGLVCV